MKKILSIVCILMLCLPAVAQKKSSSKSSSKSSVAASSYSGGSSSRNSTPSGHEKGTFGLSGDLSMNFESQKWAQEQADGSFQENPIAGQNDFSIFVGAHYFVIKNLEVGGTLGLTLVASPNNNFDANNKELYTTSVLFHIKPTVYYHIPLCSWCHYVPGAFIDLGFGSSKAQLPQNVTSVSRPNSEYRFGLDVVNFEFIFNKHLTMTASIGDIFYGSRTIPINGNRGNDTLTTSGFYFNLLQLPTLGIRYYF